MNAGQGEANIALNRATHQRLSVSVAQLELEGGGTFDLPSPGVTAIVGANNVGKSTVLRNVVQHLERRVGEEPGAWRLVERVGLRHHGSVDDLKAWLAQNAHYVTSGNTPGWVRGPHQNPLPETLLFSGWADAKNGHLGHLARFVTHFAEPMARISMTAPASQRSDISQPPQHPIHFLEDSADLLAQFIEISSAIFRQPLTLDRLSGNTHLRVGRVDCDTPPIDAVTSAYRDALATLPPLHEQGDGMKCLLGMLLPIVTASYPIVLVDEPEAFLHPPQAVAVGRELARLAVEKAVQVVLATHDRNVLVGLLESGVDVTIARLSRDGNRTSARQLQPELVRRLWVDPALRYSNVLDGLFHRFVVLAEGEQDCRFYTAALDELDASTASAIPPGDVLFVPVGGKAALPRMVAALRQLNIHVVSSPDLDILNDVRTMRRLVEAHGGDWSSLETDYRVATAPFREPRDAALCSDVQTAVNRVFQERPPTDVYSASVRREVASALRSREDPWTDLKRFGNRAIPRGQAAKAGKRLLTRLDELGICCVRVGELENFAPDLEVSKGPEWLPAALGAGAHRTRKARRHVQRLLAAAERVSATTDADHRPAPL